MIDFNAFFPLSVFLIVVSSKPIFYKRVLVSSMDSEKYLIKF